MNDNDADDKKKPIEDANIIRSGRLDVGDGHEIYWVDWGNKDEAEPIMYLHGGPGGGFDEKRFDIFDPKKHRVIFHDQRGAGRSTPFASIENNTSADLVGDITKLKQELGFKTVSLYGFSWGATLALLYAIDNPEQINTMLIGGVFLAREADNEFYLNGGIRSHFPEVWARFQGHVPESQRDDVGGYYKQKLLDNDDEAERKKFAREWMIYESSILKLDFEPATIERNLQDFASESLAYLEAHYLLNGCFIEDDYILNNAEKLRSIKTVIVQGRYDFICMPSAAYELKEKPGDNAILQVIEAGHSGKETTYREVVAAYLNTLF